MDENLTTTTTASPATETPSVRVVGDLSGHFALFGAGLTMVVVNSLVAYTICYQKALINEKMYVILLGLAVIDGLDGIPTISGAATQIRLLLNSHPRHLHLKLTPFQCMKHIHVWMFAFTDTAQCLMILMISLDRLFAVSWPLVYFEMGRRYALGLVTFVSVYSCVSGTAAWIYPLAYSGPATISPLCINRLAYGPFQSYLNLIRVLFAYGSVIVYLLVLLVYRVRSRHGIPSIGNANSLRARAAARERRLTMTLGIQSLATFLLYIIPMTIASDKRIPLSMIIWVFTLTNGNAIVNLFLYVVRLSDFRRALISTIFGCHRLPPNTRLWGHWAEPRAQNILMVRRANGIRVCRLSVDENLFQGTSQMHSEQKGAAPRCNLLVPLSHAKKTPLRSDSGNCSLPGVV